MVTHLAIAREELHVIATVHQHQSFLKLNVDASFNANQHEGGLVLGFEGVILVNCCEGRCAMMMRQMPW